MEDRLDRLLAGRLDEGTGVHDDELGLSGVRGTAVTLRIEVALELVGVHLVLGAPQGLQPVEAHVVAHTPHTRPVRRSDGARQARYGGPTSGCRATWRQLPSGEGGI